MKTRGNHHEQIPLYGLVYDPGKRTYDYTLAGQVVPMTARPSWEKAPEEDATDVSLEPSESLTESAAHHAAAYAVHIAAGHMPEPNNTRELIATT